MCFFLSFAFACFFFNGCFGFLSDIVIASFPHIHMSNLFPLLCLRYSTVFWQCQPCLLIILCFFCEYDKFTHFSASCQAFCVCVFSVNLQNPPKKVIDILNFHPYNDKCQFLYAPDQAFPLIRNVSFQYLILYKCKCFLLPPHCQHQ